MLGQWNTRLSGLKPQQTTGERKRSAWDDEGHAICLSLFGKVLPSHIDKPSRTLGIITSWSPTPAFPPSTNNVVSRPVKRGNNDQWSPRI